MTMSNDRGVFCISRRLFDSGDPFFGGEPFTRREAWQWLIAEAAWKPRRVRVSTGRGDTFIELDRGQLSHSRSYMQKAGIGRRTSALGRFWTGWKWTVG